MALNFILQTKTEDGYDALFPSTTAKALVGALLRTEVTVTVPVSTDITQTIAVAEITSDMANAPFDVYLASGSAEDYSTITQIQAQEGNLVITRLYGSPEAELTLTLLFYETGGGV